ncbi:MAG: SDR family oxidoreductase [Rhodothermales bacterium]|nr:SDR family oxidoreductase [Rhodothermales bacterium]
MNTNGSSPEVVVVTGATAGVGRAVVRAFARDGAKLGLIARGKSRLETTKQEVEALGGEAIALPCDVADAEAVERAAQAVEDAFGRIDVWVNNAMTSVLAEFWEIEPEEYARVTDVVYHGQVYGAMAALKRMRPRDRGTIVFVGSALAYRGIPLQSAYCGGKHAIQGLFDSLRTELLHTGSGVKVSMVQLPALNTPQFDWVRSKLPNRSQPVPPIYQPEIAADAIVHAARTGRREMWVGYPTVQAVAGNRVAPGLADRYLASSGYGAQQTDEPEDPDRPDNLFEPVEGPYGARGRFSHRAKESSPELWASKRKGWLTVMGGIAAGAALSVLSR